MVIAKFLSALASTIKGIAEPSLLNSSIPASRYKSHIFAKITSKGISGYYVLGAISKIVAGYLFIINGYLPMICSFVVLVLVTILSMFFIEPITKSKSPNRKTLVAKQIEDLKEGFAYTLKSERLKALILSASLLTSIFSISLNYRTSLLQDIHLSSSSIGIISAVLTFVSAYASKKQNEFHHKRKNKSLITIALTISISNIIAGFAGLKAASCNLLLVVILACYITSRLSHGIYFTIINRYFRNFTNAKIDTKIFATKNMFTNLCSAFMGFLASFLLDKMSTAYCMIVMGIAFTILFILTEKYMKTRVGLRTRTILKTRKKIR